MGRLFNIAKWGATLGSEPQNFLGAKWVRSILARTSKKKQRIWALRMLSLSPHYFVDSDNPKYAGMSGSEYLEAVFDAYVGSRKEIYQALLAPHLRKDDIVIDYGCGPGFLTKLIGENVDRVYGCDISEGVLACAEILNSAPNLFFVRANDEGLKSIAAGSIDVVFSYAMVQHLSDEIFDHVLESCRKKLKNGGRIVMHVQLDDPAWKTEDEWRSDASMHGRLKLKYGLNCFARTAAMHKAIVESRGFVDAQIENLASFLHDDPQDLSTQAILTATKR